MSVEKKAKTSQSCPEVTSTEKAALKCIFDAILESGRTPTIQEMATSLGKAVEDIVRTLNGLERKDLLLRKKGTQEVISIYPFSLTPTAHQIFLEDGKRLFAMCALDALGMPIMFKRNVKIVSQCEECKQEITVEIANMEIVSASLPGIWIWSPTEKKGCAAETCCPKVNYFCSREHLREWEIKNPDLAGVGRNVGLMDAFPRIKVDWRAYGEKLGIR